MRLRTLLFALATPVAGCWDLPPGNVPLTPGGEEVEVLLDDPSPDVYEPYADISVQAIGLSNQEATRSARRALRNRGAELHARFVSVDDITASLAWDLSGRTIVTVRGRAFREKQELPPARAR